MNDHTNQEIASLLEAYARNRHTPCATYRIQINADFTFADAQRILAYIRDLGVSDCYASPLLRARAGSPHGYDICDHSQINPVIGGDEGFEVFSRALKEHRLGLLFDTVPNHMGIGDVCNAWWMDVLENGPSSIYASYFDIDWEPVPIELKNKVLLPILGDQYGNVLERGELRLAYAEGAFFVHYYDHTFPVAPCTYDSILRLRLEELGETLDVDNEHLLELQSILTAISYLPRRTELEAEKIAERNREKEVIKRRIAALCEASDNIRAAIDASVEQFNGQVGEPGSFDLLDELLTAQAYRPAFWRVATEEINYRRFFDINDLAAIRVEKPEVFNATHQLIFDLLAQGKITGLRIDHPDGLWDPLGYFRQLQQGYLECRLLNDMPPGDESPDRDLIAANVTEWLDNYRSQDKYPIIWPLYVVAEKILASGEPLSQVWAVDGTTGYDFLNAANGIFVDANSERAFNQIYGRFINSHPDFSNLVNSTKKMIMLVSLSSEINELSHRLERIAEKNRRYRDFTLNSITFAIREIIAALQIYRTYITVETDEVSRHDQNYVERAVAEARKRNPRTARSVFDFIRDVLLLRNLQDFSAEEQPSLVEFVMKFQQITGPIMAKGLEDTAFYVYDRLVSLNEVGGHPEHFGVSLATFHRQNAERQKRWPHSLLTTSTHDTKRSEDVRARINVLSEMPKEWNTTITRWSRQNARKKTTIEDLDLVAPDRNDEYLLYQTLVGAWPIEAPEVPIDYDEFRERIANYMQKATKEAKVHTSWVNANEEYDAAVRHFVMQVLDSRTKNPFFEHIREFQRRVAFFGRFNSLSQTVLKLTSPGVPDLYQGTELWDLSLVDPDNRRPVDYSRRQELLADMRRWVEQAEQTDDGLLALADELLETSYDGRIKLYVIWRTLAMRHSSCNVFTQGEYHSIDVEGARQDHVCAFARRAGDEADPETEVLVIVPRLVLRLMDGEQQPPLGPSVWGRSWLNLSHVQVGQTYRNVYTGEMLKVKEYAGTPGLPLSMVFARFPIAVLERVNP